MYDVIFVRLKQHLSMIFWKYQLQYAYFQSRIILAHNRIYLLLLNIPCITYSMYAVILR